MPCLKPTGGATGGATSVPSTSAIAHFVYRHTWALLLLLFGVVMGAVSWGVYRQQQELVLAQAVEYASNYAQAHSAFRSLYAKHVIAPLRENAETFISERDVEDGKVPLPVTMNLLLARGLADQNASVRVRLFSPYPFPWRVREGGLRDEFGVKAWNALNERPDQPFFSVEETGDRQRLRYAIADVMQGECVACHNDHPETPLTGWKKGDVRGVLEVSMPMDSVAHRLRSSVGKTYVWLLALCAICLSALLFALRRTALERQVRTLQRRVDKAKRFGQYTLLSKLGEGGMGVVYRAEHALMHRPTAIKLLSDECASKSQIARFEREVQLTSRLSHPNTITIYDYGRTTEGQFYYAMELLDGAPLDRIVASTGPMPFARVLYVWRQIAEALEEAHGAGLVHRDIKPANIMLCKQGGKADIAKLLDFGLVKNVLDDTPAHLSTDGLVTGTPLYLAPESIVSPSSSDRRSDIYSLGAVIYYILTGSHVFEHGRVAEICAKHLHEIPMAPSERLGLPIPEPLERLVLDCLAKAPSDRPQTSAELIRRIDACTLESRWTEADARQWWVLNSDQRSASSQPAISGLSLTVRLASNDSLEAT